PPHNLEATARLHVPSPRRHGFIERRGALASLGHRAAQRLEGLIPSIATLAARPARSQHDNSLQARFRFPQANTLRRATPSASPVPSKQQTSTPPRAAVWRPQGASICEAL